MTFFQQLKSFLLLLKSLWLVFLCLGFIFLLVKVTSIEDTFKSLHAAFHALQTQPLYFWVYLGVMTYVLFFAKDDRIRMLLFLISSAIILGIHYLM